MKDSLGRQCNYEHVDKGVRINLILIIKRHALDKD
jgi:hypothetical protein